MTDLDDSHDIAVIGLAGRFPGAADVDSFWTNLQSGVESIAHFTAEELHEAGVAAETTNDPRFVPAWGVLEDADLFDAQFFGFSAREATLLDPQQRILLECAWHAVEDAGHSVDRLPGRVGVYAGGSMSTYLTGNLLSGRPLPVTADGLEILVANDKDYLASRISYKLGLDGPAVCAQSACSTSLLAVHLAAQALLDYECDVALAGGITVRFPQRVGYLHQEGMILSPDGHCRPFDARAEGTVSGSGGGVVVLRRLGDAIADGDRIDAVIKGSAVNNDGSSKVGYTAPSVTGQSQVIAAALAAAEVEPRTVTAIEAHGTGTQLGDPIEIAALSKVFAGADAPTESVISSVKSNIGHLDSAAGVASLIKAVLQVRDGALVPSVNFSEPNSQIDFDATPFRVATETTKWQTGAEPRRMGVSAFGFGGTNVHVILEEAPTTPAPVTSSIGVRRPGSDLRILPVSGRAPGTSVAAAERLGTALRDRPELELADVAFTAQQGRRHQDTRSFVVAESTAEAAQALTSGVTTMTGQPAESGMTWLFTGQGSQYPGMARDVYDAEPAFADAFDSCAELFDRHLEIPLRDVVYGPSGAATELLTRTDYTQAALFAVEYAMAKLLLSWGMRPDAVAGHSIGEYVAACVAGVFDLEAATAIVAVRGRLMQSVPGGSMVSVGLPADEVRTRLPEGLDLAAVNGPELCVVAGPSDQVETFATSLAADDVATRTLHTSHAFHSSMMDPVITEFEREISACVLKRPEIPFVSGRTGGWLADDAARPGYWSRQIRETVLFGPAIETLLEHGHRTFVELGPGATLTTLARGNRAARGAAMVTTIPSAQDMQQDDTGSTSTVSSDGARQIDGKRHLLAAVGAMWQAGWEPDWAAVAGASGDRPLRRVSLPGYPFQRRRYWAEPNAPAAGPGVSIGESAGSDATVPEAGPGAGGIDLDIDADARPVLANEYIEPATPTQRIIADIWSELLGVQPVGLTDIFVELGGHSVLATKVVSRIKQQLGVEIPLRRLVRASTVEAVAELVVELGGGVIDTAASGVGGTGHSAGAEVGASEEFPVAVPDPEHLHDTFALSEIQQVQWLGRLGTFSLGNVGAHMYWEVDAVDLDIPRLEDAWNRVMERHAMLRAVFTADGYQKVLPDVGRYRIDVLDLRDVDDVTRSERLDTLRDDLSHAMRPADEWPLFDIRAVLLPNRLVRLFLGFELMMADMGSVRILLRDWRAMYENPALELEPLGITFRDYQRAADNVKSTELYQRSLDYWRDRVATIPGAPDLPLAISPDQVTAPRFVPRTQVIERDLWDRVKSRAAIYGVTPSAVLLAAYALVLGTWTRSGAFTLNVTSNVRLPVHEDAEKLVGGFASFGLLPVDLVASASVLGVARDLQEQNWHDLEYRYLNGVEVLRELARQKGDQAGALMPVVFTSTLVNEAEHDSSMVDWLGELAYEVIQTPQVWLDAAALEVADGLCVAFPAVDALFPDGMVDEMFDAYANVLRQLGADDDLWTQLPELTPGPDRELIGALNDTEGSLPDGMLFGPFVDQAVADPHRVAVIANGRSLTYGELYERACAVAWQLRDRGVGPGQRVGIAIDKSTEQIVATMAVVLTGAAYLPLDAGAPADRQDTVVTLGECRIVLVDHSMTGEAWPAERAWPAGVTSHVVVGGADAPTRSEPPAWVGTTEDTAYVIFTSGSTGVPKGVVMSHQAALNTCVDVNERYGIGAGDVVLGLSALNFDLSVWDIFGVLGVGGTLVLPEPAARRDPARWLELVGEHGVTVWNTVPALMQMLVEHIEDVGGETQLTLGTCLLSGDWIPVDLPARIRAVSPACHVISLGGATEAGIWSVAYEIGDVDPAWDSIPYGRPLRNQSMYVLNDRMQRCPVWVTGDLYIGGAGLADGYWNDTERTEAAFVVHPDTGERLYRTGDLARLLPDGELQFRGRVDFQVKIGGNRIELGEIDAVLAQHECVVSAVAAAVGPRHQRRLVAGIVLDPSDSDAAEVIAEVRAHAEAALPSYMVPGTIATIDQIPLSTNGKVDREKLGELDAEVTDAPGEIELTAAAERIATIAADVLGVDSVDPYRNFFELGGDSIAGVRVMTRASREGVPVVLQDLFEAQSIAELGQLVTQRETNHDPSADGGAELSPVQRRTIEVAETAPAPGTRSVRMPVATGLPPESVQECLGEVIATHDALRLRLIAGEGATWTQAVAPVGEMDAYLPVIELGGLEPEVREAAVLEMLVQVAEELDPVRGPMGSALLIDRGDQGRELAWVLHHVVADARSCQVLAEDLTRAMESMARSEPVVLPPPEDAFATWASGIKPWVPLPLPPRECAAESGPDRHRVTAVLDAAATADLLDGADKAFRASLDDCVLAAVGAWDNRDERIDIVVDGREVASIEGAYRRTVGDFDWLAAVDVSQRRDRDGLGGLVRTAKDARNAIRRRLADEESARRGPDSPGFAGPSILVRVAPMVSGSTSYRLATTGGIDDAYDVVVTVTKEAQALHVTVNGVSNMHGMVDDLTDHLATTLREIATASESGVGTDLVAEDFPMAELDDAELAGLLAELGAEETQ